MIDVEMGVWWRYRQYGVLEAVSRKGWWKREMWEVEGGSGNAQKG